MKHPKHRNDGNQPHDHRYDDVPENVADIDRWMTEGGAGGPDDDYDSID